MEIKSELSQNEITFMTRMEKEILPNRQNADMNTLKSIGRLVGIDVNITCRTCAAKGGIDMINHYGRLKPKYQEYLNNKQPERLDVYVFPEEIEVEQKTQKRRPITLKDEN